MKKILWIESYIPHYRVDLYKKLYEFYNNKGDEFFVCSNSEPPKIGRTGVKGHVIPSHLLYNREYIINIGKWSIYWQKGLIKIIQEIEPDVIIFQGHISNLTSWIIPNLYKNKIFVSFQCGYEYRKSELKDVLLSRYLTRFKLHLAYHSGAKNYLLDSHVPSSKIVVLHNTINEEKLITVDRDAARKYLSKKYRININDNVILFIGVLLKEKRVEILIDMMQYLDYSYKLLIVGDGPNKKNLLKYTNSENIIFTGSKYDDRYYYFCGADLLVLPGTGGLALNEALYYGLPILSGYADGSAEDLVHDGVNGYRIDNLSPKKLSYTVMDVINHKNNLGNESKKLSKKYSFNKYIDRITASL